MSEDDFRQFRVFLEERQRSIEASFHEFKAQLKEETGRFQRAATDMQRTVNELDKSLTSISAANWPAKLDKLEARFDKLEEFVRDKQDARIRALENWRYYVLGVAAVAFIVWPLITGWILKHVL